MKDRPAFSKLELASIGALVALAAWLRFYRFNQIEFLWDQAEIAKWAFRMGREGQITWVGPPSSTGLYSFFPAIWLLAIPFALSPSPVVATGFIALLNVIAVPACYLLTRRWFGRTAAWVAALLFAVAPWAVIYSRKIWQSELIAPFTPLYAYTGWRAFVHGRRWALLAHGLTLALVAQIHFAGLAMVPLTVLWASIFWRRIDWRWALLAALLAALTLVPYFAYDAQHQWFSVRQFTNLMKKPPSLDADALRAAWITAAGLDLHLLIGPDRYPEFTAATPNVRWIFTVEGVLAFGAGLLALGLAARHLLRHKSLSPPRLDEDTATALLAATWLAMPILFQTRHTVPVVPHYFSPIFPAPYILIGWLLARASRLTLYSLRFTFYTLRFTLLLIIILAASQAYEVNALLRFATTHDTLHGYDTPISYDLEAVRTAKRLGQELGGAEVILLSEGDEPRSYEMPAAADTLLHDVPHRAVDIRTALAVPAGPAVYWSTYQMTPGEALLGSLTPELVQERVPLREGIRAYRFYAWPGGEPPIPGLQRLPQPPRWANGAQLIGYRVEGDLRPGGSLRWTLVWRPSRTPTEDVYYHWFNHLLDEQGQMHSQKDGPSVLPAYWRAGDTIFNWFDIPIPPDAPPGDYTMRVGMYVYPDVQNVPLLDQAGQPAGEWITLGPISIGP